MKLIMLINVKMPTTVGILIFISMSNSTSENFNEIKLFILVFMSSINFMLSSIEHENSFINLGSCQLQKLVLILSMLM